MNYHSSSIHTNVVTHNKQASWQNHWMQLHQSWRSEPMINIERQTFLRQRLALSADVEYSYFPLKDVSLCRADIEWLLAAHDEECGPIHWFDPLLPKRAGLDLRGANLRHVDLRGLPLNGMLAGLSWTDWLSASDEQRELAAAHLEGARLDGAQLVCASLNGAYLSRASLRDVQMSNAALGGAFLDGARLAGACLQETNFTEAHMSAVCLSGADLSGAYLIRAHLSGDYLL